MRSEIEIDFADPSSVLQFAERKMRTCFDPKLRLYQQWAKAVLERKQLNWHCVWPCIQLESLHIAFFVDLRPMTVCQAKVNFLPNRREIRDVNCDRCLEQVSGIDEYKRLIQGKVASPASIFELAPTEPIALIKSFDQLLEKEVEACQRLEFVEDPRRIIKIHGD